MSASIRPKVGIICINDRRIYNIRYRSHLIRELGALGYDIQGMGLFDRPMIFPFTVIRLMFLRRKFVISSNLKSNLISLLFVFAPKLLILNGLGRYRRYRLFRKLVIFLFKRQRRTKIIVQNYADFRFFRRFCQTVEMTWLPGSGGIKKQVGASPTRLIVQRDNKIASVITDVKNLFRALPNQGALSVVGCDDNQQLEELLSGFEYTSQGYVNSDDILKSGGIFVQPSGYGEGFPHTLADAISSGMAIYISNREYVRLGLHKLTGRRNHLGAGWSELRYNHGLENLVGQQAITQGLVNICVEEMATYYGP